VPIGRSGLRALEELGLVRDEPITNGLFGERVEDDVDDQSHVSISQLHLGVDLDVQVELIQCVAVVEDKDAELDTHTHLGQSSLNLLHRLTVRDGSFRLVEAEDVDVQEPVLFRLHDLAESPCSFRRPERAGDLNDEITLLCRCHETPLSWV
jgi:hypothetical protein